MVPEDPVLYSAGWAEFRQSSDMALSYLPSMAEAVQILQKKLSGFRVSGLGFGGGVGVSLALQDPTTRIAREARLVEVAQHARIIIEVKPKSQNPKP